ncbi:MAG: lysozyme [Acidobacteriaceae bacterium]|nr:lysozyme [Acidobacteriaceae bacterium]
MPNLTYSYAGLRMTKMFEGLSLTAYADSGGVWTIGYGHTGLDIHQGLTITREQADKLLTEDVARAAEAVNRLVKVPLTQNQFDALVDFTFNLGPGALTGSTLLRLLNSGDYNGAAAQFERWVHAGGVPLPGLIRRRRAEAELFTGKASDAAQV